ncbi:hypothetical protein Lal_00046525 [Lupinus albus]|nr:hypothetical protein Lal_00046525 [Lupinus albus]
MVACKEKSSRNMSHTDFPIFWNYKMLAGWKNHEIISARRKIVKLCGALCPISISTCAKNQVKIRPVASEKPSMSPQKKGCPVLDRGFLHISLLLGGAACLPTHLGGSGWRAMGLPPSAPASFPKNAGAFFHGHVGNSTESKIVHAESSSMACHGAPSQRPSKLSQACWCVFPWPCGKFDRVKNSPRRIQVVRVPVLAGPTEKCGHLVVSLSGTMTHLACSKFFACSSRSKSKILMPSSLWSSTKGASSQSSGSALWAVHHGRSQGAAVFDAISNVSPVASSLGKVCSVEVPAWPHSAEMGSCAHPSDAPRLLV